MKSSKLLLTVLLSIFCFSLNAQLFIGGNVGFNASSDKTKDGGTTISNSSGYAFSFSPYAGKFLSEKFAVGIALNVVTNTSKTGVNPETISNTSSFGFGLFARYYAIKWNKLSLYAQGNIGPSFSASKSKTGGVTTKGPNLTNIALSLYPGLSYDLNDKISLQTTINLLSLGYGFTLIKNDTFKEYRSNFNFGAGLNNIVSVSSITVGAIYKF